LLVNLGTARLDASVEAIDLLPRRAFAGRFFMATPLITNRLLQGGTYLTHI